MYLIRMAMYVEQLMVKILLHQQNMHLTHRIRCLQMPKTKLSLWDIHVPILNPLKDSKEYIKQKRLTQTEIKKYLQQRIKVFMLILPLMIHQNVSGRLVPINLATN